MLSRASGSNSRTVRGNSKPGTDCSTLIDLFQQKKNSNKIRPEPKFARKFNPFEMGDTAGGLARSGVI